MGSSDEQLPEGKSEPQEYDETTIKSIYRKIKVYYYLWGHMILRLKPMDKRVQIKGRNSTQFWTTRASYVPAELISEVDSGNLWVFALVSRAISLLAAPTLNP